MLDKGTRSQSVVLVNCRSRISAMSSGILRPASKIVLIAPMASGSLKQKTPSGLGSRSQQKTHGLRSLTGGFPVIHPGFYALRSHPKRELRGEAARACSLRTGRCRYCYPAPDVRHAAAAHVDSDAPSQPPGPFVIDADEVCSKPRQFAIDPGRRLAPWPPCAQTVRYSCRWKQ